MYVNECDDHEIVIMNSSFIHIGRWSIGEGVVKWALLKTT